MTTLAQRWLMVEPLAEGWGLLNNVGPTSDQCQHATFNTLIRSYQGIQHWLNIGPTLEYLEKSMLSTQS